MSPSPRERCPSARKKQGSPAWADHGSRRRRREARRAAALICPDGGNWRACLGSSGAGLIENAGLGSEPTLFPKTALQEGSALHSTPAP